MEKRRQIERMILAAIKREAEVKIQKEVRSGEENKKK